MFLLNGKTCEITFYLTFEPVEIMKSSFKCFSMYLHFLMVKKTDTILDKL
jgi:hypothetical protein